MANEMQWNLRILGIAILAGGLVVYALYFFTSASNPASGVLRMHHTWKTTNFKTVPEAILDAAKDIKATDRQLSFKFDDKDVNVFFREVNARDAKSSIPVLLLHGMAFSSENWQNIGTLSLLGAMGYRAIAVDLPGFGKSQKQKVSDPGKFVEAFLRQEKVDRPVIVSPSMSGQYSIPYIMSEPETCGSRARGFIPVAPTYADHYTNAQYHRCEIPVMIVYGSKDTSLGLMSTNYLRNMANNEIFPMEGKGHPAYIEDPDQWHQLLYNFMLAVERE